MNHKYSFIQSLHYHSTISLYFYFVFLYIFIDNNIEVGNFYALSLIALPYYLLFSFLWQETFWNWFFCSCVGPWCIIVCLIYVQMGCGFLKFWFIVRRYQFIRYITLPSTSSIFSYFHFLYTCVHCNWNSKFWGFMSMQKNNIFRYFRKIILCMTKLGSHVTLHCTFYKTNTKGFDG